MPKVASIVTEPPSGSKGPESQAFMEMAEEELGTLYLTDYLTRFFDRLIISGLGLDRHPELRNDYFGNYTRIVYLAQTEDSALDAKAREAAERLGLRYERRTTGYGDLPGVLAQLSSSASQ